MNMTETFVHELRLIAKSSEMAERFIASWRGRVIRFHERGLTVYRLRAAASMLRSGMSRAEARDALMARYACSRRTAYRILHEAINSTRT